MISRRSFFGLLGLLPFVGKLIPQKELTAGEARAAIQAAMGLKFHPNAFEFTMRPLRCETRPRLTFAEWDRQYQGRV